MADNPNYPIEATKISFFNLGNIPVIVDLIPVMPGDVYQVNYEHPHVLVRRWKIRFDTSATPAGTSLREELGLIDAPKLVIQTMSPE